MGTLLPRSYHNAVFMEWVTKQEVAVAADGNVGQRAPICGFIPTKNLGLDPSGTYLSSR